MLSASLALGAGTPIDRASKAQLDAAQKTFDAASDLYDAKRWQEAITAFRASHDIVASPNSRLMIARALVELGRVDDAFREYEAALAEAADAASRSPSYAKTRDAVTAELREVAATVAQIHVTVPDAPAGTTVTVGEIVRDTAALDRAFVVAPGDVSVAVRSPDGRARTHALRVVAGAVETVSVDLPAEPASSAPEAPAAPAPAPAPEPALPPSTTSRRTLAWVAAGIGAAGLATFGVFGAMNNATFADLEDRCERDHCTPDRSGDIDAGRRYQTIANVGLVVGVLGAGAAVTLFATGGSAGAANGTGAQRTSFAVGAGNVSVRGRF